MAAHRYWRFLPTATAQVASYCEIGQVVMHTVVGGATVCGSGTAIASNSYSGYPPSNSYDGNLAHFWASPGPNLLDWCGYDFGSGNAFDIVEVAYYSANDNVGAIVVSFDFQYSDDGSTWVTRASIVGSTHLTDTWATFSTPEAGGGFPGDAKAMMAGY